MWLCGWSILFVHPLGKTICQTCKLMYPDTITLLSSVTLNCACFCFIVSKLNKSMLSFSPYICNKHVISAPIFALLCHLIFVVFNALVVSCNLSIKLFLDGYIFWFRMGVDSLEPRVLATFENSSILFPSWKLWYSINFISKENCFCSGKLFSITHASLAASTFCLNV